MSTTPAGTTPAAPAAETPPTTPPAPVPTAPTPPEPATPAPAEPAPAATADEPLGEGGKAALEREREARKKAEREAAAEKKRADDLAAEKLSDQEKLEKRAKDGDEAKAQGTAKLRSANLITALADKGLTGGKARAAARLLTVEFDDKDEPSNLDDAITAAKAEFGEELFAGATPNGSGDQPPPEGGAPQTPDLHQGVRVPATEEDEAAAIQMIVDGQSGATAKSPISILED